MRLSFIHGTYFWFLFCVIGILFAEHGVESGDQSLGEPERKDQLRSSHEQLQSIVSVSASQKCVYATRVERMIRLLLLPLLEPSGDNGILVSDSRSEVKLMHHISHYIM